MSPQQIDSLVNSGYLPGPDSQESRQLIETHISWVILTPQFAYKIKRPVRFSFLDFSTPERRKTACEEELRLNRRLSGIYLDVVPVVFDGQQYGIGMEGTVVDYAVKMQRVDGSRQMDLLLRKNEVTPADIEALASRLANFHRHARIVKVPFDAQQVMADFSDLSSVAAVLSQKADPAFSALIPAWVKLAEKAIVQLSPRFGQRVAEGFVREGHGDLHSRNIFLLEEPVIFDCIEFSEHLRINDVLSELAFLAMDLKRFGKKDFKGILIKKYNEVYPCFTDERDQAVFQYFLLYRASVRLKIAGLQLQQLPESPESRVEELKAEIADLSGLCRHYAGKLEKILLQLTRA